MRGQTNLAEIHVHCVKYMRMNRQTDRQTDRTRMWICWSTDKTHVHAHVKTYKLIETYMRIFKQIDCKTYMCRWQFNPGIHSHEQVDWLQSLKQFFINVSYHILVASLTLMALF